MIRKLLSVFGREKTVEDVLKDYMLFTDGDIGINYVFNAKKYSKQEAIDIFAEETAGAYGIPELEDVYQKYAKWLPVPPEELRYTFPDGYYVFCDKPERGSFAVLVIDL